jgi:TnsA endonuclease C terminal./TnsA endonuclease N terminal.
MGRHLVLTKQKIEEMKKAGRGQGESADYQPWLKVDDFPSLGRGNRVRDIHTGRIHHFFSDLEMEYFFILVWNQNIIDIREQYPLDTGKTEAIAARLGCMHPMNKDGSNYVMTTDFLVTYRPDDTDEEQYYARSVKTASELSNKRTLQKQQIEMLYWQEMNIPWKCVTEKSFSHQKAKNIRKILSFYDYSNIQDKTFQENVKICLLKEILNCPNYNLSAICNSIQKDYELKSGEAFSLFYYLASHRVIELDLEQHFLPTMPVKNFVMLDALQQKIESIEGEFVAANG